MNIPAQPPTTKDMRIPAGGPLTARGQETLRALAQEISAMDRALIRLAEVSQDSGLKLINKLRRELAGFEPCVTMIGQVKSGKTTLVNALAGWPDFLPSDVNPWTSVVTSLHLKPAAQSAALNASFRFFGEDEWDRLINKGGRLGELAERAGAESEAAAIKEQIEEMREKSKQRLGRKFELLLGQSHDYNNYDRELIERYICLGDMFEDETGFHDNQGRFADITRSADLYLNSSASPLQFCIRDTPGVNDTFMMREQITIRAIRESRSCVVVLSAHQALSAIDMALIRMISNLKARDVVIFVNRIDELSSPTTQVPEIEYSIRETLRNQGGPEDVKIVFGSALWANVALDGDMSVLPQSSASALLEWLTRAPKDTSEVWDAAGIPALSRILAKRIADGEGRDLMERTARSAANIAEGLRLADNVTIKRTSKSRFSTEELEAALKEIAEGQKAAFDADFDKLRTSYFDRVDKAQANFADRTTHALIAHLEQYGADPIWEYDPAGLRVLLRSSYTLLGARAQSLATSVVNQLAKDTMALYEKAIGGQIIGLSIAAPQVPHIEPPVALGETIVLDFRDGWWRDWWRRTLGFQAFAKKFHKLIMAETDGITTKMKGQLTDQIRADILLAIDDFLAEQQGILVQLVNAELSDSATEDLLDGGRKQSQQRALRDVAATLAQYLSTTHSAGQAA